MIYERAFIWLSCYVVRESAQSYFRHQLKIGIHNASTKYFLRKKRSVEFLLAFQHFLFFEFNHDRIGIQPGGLEDTLLNKEIEIHAENEGIMS